VQSNSSPASAGVASSAAALGAILVRRRRGIARLLVTTAAVVTTMVLIRPRTYSANLDFTASSKRSPSSLAGLASQFGFNVSVLSGEGGAQSQFYVDLLNSDGFLRATIRQPLDAARELGLPSASIADLLEVMDADPARRIERTIPKLRSHVKIAAAVRTGVVNLTVTTENPRLSYALARHLFAKLDAFNQLLRTVQAASERRYVEARALVLQRDLNESEYALAAFLRQNRQYQGSPELQFQYDRLQREVQLRAQVLGVVRQSMEQAKLDEQRDTPVLSPLEPPIVPPIPDSRHALVLLVTALFAMLLVSLIAALPATGTLLDAVPVDEMMDEARRERAEAARLLRRNPFDLLFGSSRSVPRREPQDAD
jgi:uncharacterized protein involved in exopolysaccharide biosynthesis